MKLIKIVTLALALNGAVLPLHGMQQTATQIEHINTQRVQAAYDAYASEAKWAPTVRYAAAGAVTAVALYGLYKFLQKQPVMSAETYKHFNDFTPEQQQHLVQAAGAFFGQMQLAEQAKLAAQEAATQAAAQNYSSWLSYKADNAFLTLKNSASNIGYFVTQAFELAIAAKIASYGYSIIPTASNLEWYITNRTEYERNASDMVRYMEYYTIYQHEIHDVMKLIVFDIEKILAYLQHLHEQMMPFGAPELYGHAKAHYLRATCQRYAKNITDWTNDLVDALNAQEQKQVVDAKVKFLLGEIHSAKKFVTTLYS